MTICTKNCPRKAEQKLNSCTDKQFTKKIFGTTMYKMFVWNGNCKKMSLQKIGKNLPETKICTKNPQQQQKLSEMTICNITNAQRHKLSITIGKFKIQFETGSLFGPKVLDVEDLQKENTPLQSLSINEELKFSTIYLYTFLNSLCSASNKIKSRYDHSVLILFLLHINISFCSKNNVPSNIQNAS